MSTNNSKRFYTINEMIEMTKNEPHPEFVYRGIMTGSVGFVFGPSKSGKTTFCEALGMSIATGASEFFNESIGTPGEKVLFLSLEEHYRNRTFRNAKQVDRFNAEEKEMLNNYLVVRDGVPRHILSNSDWEKLEVVIEESEAKVVFIDSLTRLCKGTIEDSNGAKEVMKSLRNLAEKTKTTIICIHHTHKLKGRPIDLDSLAGSRVIAQEADFFIGINKSCDGVRYMKEVDYRYKQNDTEFVTTFEMDECQWVLPIDDTYEYKLLVEPDGRKDSSIDDMINELLSNNGTITRQQLKSIVVDRFKKSSQAAHKRFKALSKRSDIELIDDNTLRLVK